MKPLSPYPTRSAQCNSMWLRWWLLVAAGIGAPVSHPAWVGTSAPPGGSSLSTACVPFHSSRSLLLATTASTIRIDTALSCTVALRPVQDVP